MNLYITATLGPATAETDVIMALLPGVDRLRLNTSHLAPEELIQWLRRLDSCFKKVQKQIPVVVDLQGAKMRIGTCPRQEHLIQQVRIVLADKSTEPGVIPVPHSRLFEAVKPLEQLTLNDAHIELRIERVSSRQIDAVVIRNGPLESHKGINRRSHPIPFDRVSPRDRSMIAVSSEFAFVQFACSFVLDGHEAPLLRNLWSGHLIAKVERPEAFAHLAEIDANFDEIWLCRGDLGAQAGLNRLGALQESFAKQIASFSSPAHLAGQVLEHMTTFAVPTRTEVVHLHDIQNQGFAGIVLSDETAIGRHALKVVSFLDSMRQ